MLTREQVQKVATLGRLKLSEVEIEQMTAQLGSILGYIEQLNELDTTGIEPMAHPLPMQNVFREDELTDSLSVEEALANAPKKAGDFYAVPAILEG